MGGRAAAELADATLRTCTDMPVRPCTSGYGGPNQQVQVEVQVEVQVAAGAERVHFLKNNYKYMYSHRAREAEKGASEQLGKIVRDRKIMLTKFYLGMETRAWSYNQTPKKKGK
eukprot:SAG31_NODE_2626_length_5353_cov_5.529692_4_plen_114_part_00